MVHPGGPFWEKRDAGAWSIPKGEYGPDEDPQDCARREFAEETGTALPPGALADLGSVRLRSGKQVRGYAAEGDLDAEATSATTSRWSGPALGAQARCSRRWTAPTGSASTRRGRN